MIEFFPDLSTFVSIFGVNIAWYAILIMTGAFIAYYLSLKNLKKMGFNAEDLDDLFIGVLVFGVIGARLWYVLFFDLASTLKDPMSIIRFRDGGLAIHGGLFLGIAFAYWYLKKRGYNFIHWTDAIVPNILIAQAMGRWGNFLNQEAFGGIVGESHFRFLPNFIKEIMFIDGAYRAPTFLYESVLNVLGWILITQLLKRSKNLKRGDQTFAYFIWYGVVRFIIESMRSDALLLNLGFAQLRIAQVVSIVFVLVGLYGFYGKLRKFYPRNKPVLLFDFDGTIMDTQALILETFRQVFAKHKPEYELSDAEYYSFLGPTLHDSFGKYFEPSQVEDLVHEYRTLNREIHKDFIKPMDHVIEVLDTLKAQGYPMAIVSSKLTSAVEFALELTDMQGYFDAVYGMDKYDKVKPDPEGIITIMKDMYYDRSQFIYLGDTDTDIEAGRAAGAYTVGYVFDKNREQELIKANPNVVIEDWRKLLEILEEDHEWTYNMI